MYIYIYMYVTYIYIYTNICMHIHMHVCKHKYVYLHVYMYIDMYVYSIRTLLVCVSHFDVTTGMFILYLFIHTYACDIAVTAYCTQGAITHLLQAPISSVSHWGDEHTNTHTHTHKHTHRGRWDTCLHQKSAPLCNTNRLSVSQTDRYTDRQTDRQTCQRESL